MTWKCPEDMGTQWTVQTATPLGSTLTTATLLMSHPAKGSW